MPPKNAFDWRGQPSIFSTERKESVKQLTLKAKRKNTEAPLCAFVPPEKAQKMRKAAI